MAVPSLPFSLSDINAEFGTKSLASHFSDGDGGVGSLPGNMTEFEGLAQPTANFTSTSAFTSQTGVATSTVRTAAGSRTVGTITGASTILCYAEDVIGSTSPKIRVNGTGSWVTSAMVSAGDTIQVQCTSSPDAFTEVKCRIKMNGSTDNCTFSVSTA